MHARLNIHWTKRIRSSLLLIVQSHTLCGLCSHLICIRIIIGGLKGEFSVSDMARLEKYQWFLRQTSSKFHLPTNKNFNTKYFRNSWEPLRLNQFTDPNISIYIYVTTFNTRPIPRQKITRCCHMCPDDNISMRTQECARLAAMISPQS